MKTTLTVKQKSTGTKMKLTFETTAAKHKWLETQSHDYIIKSINDHKP